MSYKIESKECKICGKKVYADEFGEFTFSYDKGRIVFCSPDCKVQYDQGEKE